MSRRRRLASHAAGLLAAASIALIVTLTALAITSNRTQTLTIQAERKRNVLSECQATNRRNINTKAIIRRTFPKGPGRVVTLSLVDALAPYYENCRARAARLVASYEK